jgi:hypothetical protein
VQRARLLTAFVGITLIAGCASQNAGASASAPGSTVDATSPAVPLVSVTASAPAQSGSPSASLPPPAAAPTSVVPQTAASLPSAQQVVSAYIDALNSHDIARAKTYLTASGASPTLSSVLTHRATLSAARRRATRKSSRWACSLPWSNTTPSRCRTA